MFLVSFSLFFLGVFCGTMWWLPKDEGWAFLYGQEMIEKGKMHILCCKDGSEGFTKQKRKRGL